MTAPHTVRSKPLPRGRHGLPREQVAASQRRRLLDATIALAADRGYAGASVSRIVATAGVSREVFYALFSSKEACWDAAIADAVQARTATLTDTLRGSGPALDRAREGIAAYLGAVAGHPAASRCVAAERPPRQGGAPAVVVAARGEMGNALGATLGLVDPFVARALMTAIDAMIDEEVIANGADGVDRLAGPLGRLLEVAARGAAV